MISYHSGTTPLSQMGKLFNPCSLIDQIREKTSDLALGYNTYLLTLDGSFIHFTKLTDIVWTETFFGGPQQVVVCGKMKE